MSTARRTTALFTGIRCGVSSATNSAARSMRGGEGRAFHEGGGLGGRGRVVPWAFTSRRKDGTAGPRARARETGAARRGWALTVVAMAWFLVLINDTAVTVALPPLGRDLGLGLAGLEWVVKLYTLTFAVLTLWGGMLADRYGARPVFLAGLAAFTVSSLAAGLSPDGGALIGLRAAQGAGAALMGPAALALLTVAFTGASRSLGLGVWSGVGAAALAGGPLVGALLTSGFGWRSIFWINAPIGLLVWLVARRTLPAPPPATRAGRVDVVGGLASALGLSALIYALTQANAYGWTSPTLWALLAASAAAFALFWITERRAAVPLLDLSLLRRPNFLGGNLLGMASLAVMCSVFFFLSLYMQLAAGMTALRTGVALLPMTLLSAAVAPAVGWLVPRLGARTLIATGMAITAVGLVVLSGITPGWGASQMQPGLLVTGLGIGLSTTAITTATLGHIPDHHTGIASATLNAFRMIGLSLGIAVMGAVVAAQWPGDLARTRPTGAAFTDGIAVGLLINAGIATAATVLAIVAVRSTRPRHEDRAAAPAAAKQEGRQR